MRDPGLPADLFAPDLTLETGPLAGGPADLAGAGPHPLALRFDLGAGGLGAWNGLGLRVDNHSGALVLAGVRLIHANGAVSVTGNREPVPPGEGQGLYFPRESFGVLDGPGLWEEVRSLVLRFCRPKDARLPRVIRVQVRGLWGLARRVPRGPRLGRLGLARVLVPDRSRGPLEGEGRDWGPFRPGGPAGAIPPPAAAYFTPDRRARILAGEIMGRPVGWPPDWGARGDGTLEWAHFLHRHHWLRPLVRSLGRYPGQGQVLAGALGSWIGAHPVPVGSDGGASPAWETLSVAFRLREWCHLAGAAWGRPEFAPGSAGGLRAVWLAALWEHARHLMDHQGHPGNWRLLEAAALALVGLLFPEFQEAERWAAVGIARLAREWQTQFYGDGGHFEVSPLYHALCLQAGLEVRETARGRGWPWPEAIETRLIPACEALAVLCRPDLSWPSLNDSGGARDHYRALFRYAGLALARPDFLWIGTRGRRGTPPADRFRVLPQSGLAVARTGLGPGAQALLFRAGPPGANHVHGDCLSLEYCAQGRPAIVDPGIRGYAPGPAAERARSGAAHTMPLVDGRGPARAALSFAARIRPARGLRWGRLGTGVFVSGAYRAQGVRVERRVLFQADGTVLVRDRFAGAGEHCVASHWQWMPGGLRIEPGVPAAIHQLPGAGGPELVLAAVAVGTRPEIERLPGWVTLGRRDLRAPAVRFSLRGTLPLVLRCVISPQGTPGLGDLGQWTAGLAERFDQIIGDA